MPLYDYECDCGKTWDALVKYADKDSQVCECGKTVTANFPAPNIQTFSLMSKEDQKKSLMRRSDEHSKKTVAKDGIPEKSMKKLKRMMGG